MIAARGALPAAEAVDLTVRVLDALAGLDAADPMHRTIAPSRILLDESVQVTGICSAGPMAQDGAADRRAQDVATPAARVYAAGRFLAELLAGRSLTPHGDAPPMDASTPPGTPVLPAGLGADVDDVLRAIVSRAIARDASERHTDVDALRQTLIDWSATVPVGQVPGKPGSSAESSAGPLASLMQRMRHNADFPAMSNSVGRIQGIVSSDTESVSSLTNEILKDVALTNKLLRMVNSVHLARGGGAISTVSRAVSLVGFNGIRNMALGLVLLEHMQDKAHANDLKDEFVRCLMAGTIAAQLCAVARDSEEAFVGGMFQNLGRLLAEFYFPEEARTVRRMVHSVQKPVSEPLAAAQVLGLDFETLGIGVAKGWGLPEGIQRCMRKPAGRPPTTPPADPIERLRWISAAANDIADVLLHTETLDVEARLTQCGRHHANVLGFSAQEMEANILTGRRQLLELTAAMQLQVRPGSGAARLLQLPGDMQPDGALRDPLVLHAVPVGDMGPADAVERDDPQFVTRTLTAGIADVTHAVAEGVGLSDVLRMVLETMLRAMPFERIIFCMLDPKTNALTGRFGLGSGVAAVVREFQVSLKPTQPDLFATVCNRGVDTLISDATEARVAGNLPRWYRKSVNATTFLLLPLHLKGKPFGLIYADMGAQGGVKLDDRELSLLRTLRDQAVTAFRHAA